MTKHEAREIGLQCELIKGIEQEQEKSRKSSYELTHYQIYSSRQTRLIIEGKNLNNALLAKTDLLVRRNSLKVSDHSTATKQTKNLKYFQRQRSPSLDLIARAFHCLCNDFFLMQFYSLLRQQLQKN